MIVLALAIGVAYAAGVRSLAGRGRRWPIARSGALVGAMAALVATLFVDDERLSGHMVEHILIGMVAPFLLAMSGPITLALQTTPPWMRTRIRTALHRRTIVRLAHPVVGLVLFGSSLIAIYLTPLLQLSARNPAVHVGLHLHLLAVGALFMWPLIGVDPVPGAVPFGARLLAVLAAVPFHAFLGVAIMSATTPLAPSVYPSLDDQHDAGALLWISGELMSFVLASIVLRAWFTADQRAARRERLSGAPHS